MKITNKQLPNCLKPYVDRCPKKKLHPEGFVYTDAEKDILLIYTWYKENYFEEPSDCTMNRAMTLLDMHKGDLDFVKYEVDNWVELWVGF